MTSLGADLRTLSTAVTGLPAGQRLTPAVTQRCRALASDLSGAARVGSPPIVKLAWDWGAYLVALAPLRAACTGTTVTTGAFAGILRTTERDDTVAFLRLANDLNGEGYGYEL